MEVNKSEAERCRDMGAEALRAGQHARAVKLLSKSLQLYPLPGVKALLGQAERRLKDSSDGGNASSSADGGSSFRGERNSNTSGFSSSRSNSSRPPASAASASQSTTGRDFARSASSGLGGSSNGRAYTDDQVAIVSQILKAKKGGRGAHYRVLGLESNANDAAIKKAYRKLALKLHPDKNAAPHADEAFKSVGLAYATLSDPQKRTIYDRYGEEDPDNRGGGGGAGMRQGGMHFRPGQDVSPEEIFNMFFGGGMAGGMGGMGGPGVRFYTNMPRHRAHQRQHQQQPQQQEANSFSQFVQLLPLLMLFFLSFFNFPGDGGSGATGGSRYFSLTHSPPFVNPLATRLTTVKDIPYFVTDKFMRTYHRDRYQLAQVERMVESAYEKYLIAECKNQQIYKRQLEKMARERKGLTPVDRERQLKKAAEFELTRCIEFEELFPRRKTAKSWNR